MENMSGYFAVPRISIVEKQVIYKSSVHLTPLNGPALIDGEAIRVLVAEEFRKAGFTPADVDTGAVIITGETSRKENARAVTNALSEYAGDFVVATAGPDLESVLAAKGAGADAYSGETGKKVLHMDIGGGTANLAWIEDGRITQTGCMNVGGRLVKLDENGVLTYVSTVLDGIFQRKVGERPALSELEDLAKTLVSALEMVAGLRPSTDLPEKLWTRESGMLPPALINAAGGVLSFSGGVADCIEQGLPPLAFGDLGPILGKAIRKSRLCAGNYRLGQHTIRATVIGAGCHSAQLSGSTVYYQNVTFPMKNLPVAASLEELSRLDGPGVLALMGGVGNYAEIRTMAETLAAGWPKGPVYLALESDAAKALGQALALRLGRDRPVLCIDRVRFGPQSYLDVGRPLHDAIPVVVKTLILSR
jgi:ethanolamine utilization protein EutA